MQIKNNLWIANSNNKKPYQTGFNIEKKLLYKLLILNENRQKNN